MKKHMSTLIITISVFSIHSLSFAQGFARSIADIEKKQELKRSNRWTIFDWLAAKAKFRLADQWLALNSSDTDWEIFIGGAQAQYDKSIDGVESSPGLEGLKSEIGIYYSIFGIEASYSDVSTDKNSWEALFNLRLLGTSTQNSNLTVGFGHQVSNEVTALDGLRNEFANQFWQASLTFYLFSFFGFEGNYRSYLSAESDQSIDYSGSRISYGAFIEISFIRLYCQVFQEKIDLENSTAANDEVERDGLLAGARFYF